MSELPGSAVCVVGLDLPGLSLAVRCAQRGRTVVGADVRAPLVEAINEGTAPADSTAGLADALRDAQAGGLLWVTTDVVEAVSGAAVVVVCVPVGLTESDEIDFRDLDSAALSVGAGLAAGAVVILRTPVPVGTTRGRFAQLIQSASGLEAGRDFHLAFSPVHVGAETTFQESVGYPRLVGGTTDEAGAASDAFFSSVQDSPVVLLSSTEAAEYAKLVETT